MDPNGNQFSIDYPFNGNTARWHRPPLPRSFKPPGHGIRACESFPSLLTAHLGLYSPFYEKRCYGLFWGLSWDFLHRFIKPLLGLSCFWGNSRALVLSIIQENQTRLYKAWWFSCGFHWAGRRSQQGLLRGWVCRLGLRRTFYSHPSAGRNLCVGGLVLEGYSLLDYIEIKCPNKVGVFLQEL